MYCPEHWHPRHAPEWGLIAFLGGQHTGSRMARWLLPLVIFIPVLITWLHLAVEKMGWFGDRFGEALTTLSISAIMGLLVWLTAQSLNSADRERNQVAEKVRIQNLRLTILREIDQAILAADSVEEIVHAALDHIHELIGCQRVALPLVDPATNQVHIYAARTSRETSVPAQSQIPLAQFQGAISQAILQNQHVVINDLRTLTDVPPLFQDLIKDGLRSSCIMPLFAQDTLIGTLGLSSETVAFFDEDRVALIREVANQIAIAITQSRLMEALRVSERRLQLAATAGNVGIWDWDIVNNKLIWDASMYRLYGIAEQDFSGVYEAWSSMLHPDDRLYAEGEVQAARQGEREYAPEFRIIRPDGVTRILKGTGQTIFGQDGRALRMIGTNIDITEPKQVQHALAVERATLAQRVEERTTDLSRANAELAQANRLKDEFLWNMSHELRTPLNAILGFSEILLEELRGPLNPQQQSALQNIETSGRHLLLLINDILDLSKIEAGHLDLQLTIVSIADACQSSLMFIKESAFRKSLKVNFQLKDPLAQMEADPRRLKQMLVNLLSNAVKFTPAHGQIQLEVSIDGEAGIIYFVVQDTGIGISPEDRRRLFQPFTQLDSRLNRQHEGTGLGLALVRRLAEMHGGSVTVESELGTGSCFTIALPYHPRLTPARQEPVTAAEHNHTASLLHSAPKSSNSRIMLAEDNEANIETIGSYLRARGYRVVVVRNGQEALEQIAEARPDLILMDVQMPVMDGLEAIRQLRTSSEYSSIPIIALTALVMTGDRERCLEAGANEYLSKPVRLKGLVEMIEMFLR